MPTGSGSVVIVFRSGTDRSSAAAAVVVGCLAIVVVAGFVDGELITEPVRAAATQTGGDVLMLSRAQEYDVTIGTRITLDCEFHMDDFNMFNNPTVWYKTQQDERAHINILAVALEPFAGTRRFEVYFIPQRPRYRLRLVILDAAIEDSGNYTCEVRGRRSTVLSQVTHTVYVRWPLTSLKLSSDGAPESVTSTAALTTLSVNDGDMASLRCSAVGGCPPPELTLRIGDTDVTSQFRRLEHPVNVTGERGLRRRICGVTLQTTQLVVSHRYDRMPIRCTATAGGHGNRINANSTQILLLVQHSPLISCSQTAASIDDSDVRLQCNVRSRPGPSALYWLVDSNGTTVSNNEAVNEYWAVTDVGDGTLATILYLRKATHESFRKYFLVAENALGTTTYGVELSRAEDGSPKTRSNDPEPVVTYSSADRWGHQPTLPPFSAPSAENVRGLGEWLLQSGYLPANGANRIGRPSVDTSAVLTVLSALGYLFHSGDSHLSAF